MWFTPYSPPPLNPQHSFIWPFNKYLCVPGIGISVGEPLGELTYQFTNVWTYAQLIETSPQKLLLGLGPWTEIMSLCEQRTSLSIVVKLLPLTGTLRSFAAPQDMWHWNVELFCGNVARVWRAALSACFSCFAVSNRQGLGLMPKSRTCRQTQM